MTIKQFYRTYNKCRITDWGAYCSDEYKQFANDFRKVFRAEMKKRGINLVDFHTGHYDFCGFVEKCGRYIYFSFSAGTRNIPRLDRKDALDGFLYRAARSTRDFTGGWNNFACLLELPDSIDELFGKDREWLTLRKSIQQ